MKKTAVLIYNQFCNENRLYMVALHTALTLPDIAQNERRCFAIRVRFVHLCKPTPVLMR